MAAHISLRFLGVRAFHSAPGPQNITTGGNTGSIELHDGSQRIFINAGFGINIAGDELFAHYLKTKTPVNCTFLFSDFMFDSILGLPFFTPIHFKSTELDILTGAREIDAIDGINDAATNLFSPFTGLCGFRAEISIRTLDSAMQLGQWTIRALTLAHPLTPYPVTVWRMSHDSGADIGIVMTCDNDSQSMGKVGDFLSGCHTLICAASTSPEQDGWDLHRTGFDDALSLALNINADELYLTQFHPEMTDLLLQRQLTRLHESLPAKHASLRIHLASEIETIAPICSIPVKKAG